MTLRLPDRLRRIPAERWLLFGMMLLLSLFTVALFLQPRVGGGGR